MIGIRTIEACAAMMMVAQFALPATVMAAYVNKNELRYVDAVHVAVFDEVHDGCLHNPDALRNAVELIFRQSGIAVSEEMSDATTTHYLLMSFQGWEPTNGGSGIGVCVARYSVELYRFAEMPEGHKGVVNAYSADNLFFGWPLSETQTALRAGVTDVVTDLASEILKARDVSSSALPVPSTGHGLVTDSDELRANKEAVEPTETLIVDKAYLVQLGTFSVAENPAKVWSTAKTTHPDHLAGLEPDVIKLDHADGRELYVLRAGPLASHDAAQSLCHDLKANMIDCIVIAP